MHIGSWRLQKRLSMADGFIMLFLVYILMNGIIGSGLLPVKWLAGFLPGGATVINRMLVQQIFQTAFMVGSVVLFLRLRGVSATEIGLRPLKNDRWLFYSALWGIGTFFIMLFVSAWMIKLFPDAEPQTATNLIMQAQGRWESIAVILMVSILAPFSEELIFRGYIYHSLRAHKNI